MPVIDKVLSRIGLGRKQEVPIINDGAGNLPTIRVIGGTGLPAAQWTQRGYAAMVGTGYQSNTDVYACVSLIASAGKQVKWWDGGGHSKALTPSEELAKAVGYDVDRDISSIRDDPGKRRVRVKQATNPRASIALLEKSGGASFIEAWLSYILLSGNDFMEIDRTANSQPTMLYLLRPDRVRAWVKPVGDPAAAHMAESELVEYWRVTTTYGQTRDVQPPEMVHSKLFHPTDDIYGMAPLEAALLRVDMQNEGTALMKRMLQRGYSPGWIEAVKDSLWEDKQVAQLKERVRESKRAGEELFLENATWHQMGFNPADSAVTDQQILSKRDIASVFHVPGQLIGDTTSQTYSNYQEARRALYMEAVIPLLTQFRDDWNQTIGRELKSPLDFDKDTFDAIAAARAEATDRVQKLFASGIITQNEARRDLEYDPVVGGDTFYAPANVMPMAPGEGNVQTEPTN
jgi:HK97 family phage portal protein